MLYIRITWECFLGFRKRGRDRMAYESPSYVSPPLLALFLSCHPPLLIAEKKYCVGSVHHLLTREREREREREDTRGEKESETCIRVGWHKEQRHQDPQRDRERAQDQRYSLSGTKKERDVLASGEQEDSPAQCEEREMHAWPCSPRRERHSLWQHTPQKERTEQQHSLTHSLTQCL